MKDIRSMVQRVLQRYWLRIALGLFTQALPGNTRVPLGIKYHRITDKKSNRKRDFHMPDAGLRYRGNTQATLYVLRNKVARVLVEVYGRRLRSWKRLTTLVFTTGGMKGHYG